MLTVSYGLPMGMQGAAAVDMMGPAVGPQEDCALMSSRDSWP